MALQCLNGGCSSKLPAGLLDSIMASIPIMKDPRLLVGTETHDDAAVWKINSEVAIIQTTDFFPPLCSDPYEFGQIAATNALSDIYAMGGEAILAMNIVMFPQGDDLNDLKLILEGGASKVTEAGALVCGGHSINDATVKFGLAVTGIVHPERVITNANLKAGDLLILTKKIGSGVILAAKKLGLHSDCSEVFSSMKLLNKKVAEVMQRFSVRAATDITGFGLLGHALKMARASGVTVSIDSKKIPLFSEALKLSDLGCLPGASFSNLKYVEGETDFLSTLSYPMKMLLLDAQTSGGMLMAVKPSQKDEVLKALHDAGSSHSQIIGEVSAHQSHNAYLKVY